MSNKVKILVVDDKKIDRDGICFLIKQNNLSLETSTAGSGKEALSRIDEERFDILFTDIKMPDMTGLELIKLAVDIQPHLKTVVFSSYDQFQYAQEAINIGVSKYLLKPIDVEDFIDCLQKLINEITVTKDKKISQVFYDILYRKDNSITDLPIKKGYLFTIDFVSPFFNQKDSEKKLPPKPADFINVPLNEYQCMFIAPDAESVNSYISNLCNHFYSSDNHFLIICAGSFNSCQELRDCYSKADEYSSVKFYITKNEIAHLDISLDPASAEDNKELWETCINIGKTANRGEIKNACDMWLNAVSEMQRSRSFPISVIKVACCEIVKEHILYNEDHQTDSAKFLNKIEQSGNLEDLSNTVLEIINLPVAKNSETLAIENALNIIEEKYMEDIGLESIAAQVYLSPCYFSYLFKKTTGTNFLKYLTNYRVEKAKELLKSTHLRVGEICEKVGYSNRSYFCQIFRNSCGMSPNRYREMNE